MTATRTARPARPARPSTPTVRPIVTHETYIARIRDLALAGAVRAGTLTADEADRLHAAKLVYGVGNPGVRGTCHFGSWKRGTGTVDVVEVSAATQENWVQLMGTTLHELAHVLAGPTAGHSRAWADAAVRLGFRKRPAAAGQTYSLALFPETLRWDAHALAQRIADGSPAFATGSWLATLLGSVAIRPCSAGRGTRGGKSFGKGSGSRMRLYVCSCPKPVKVRAATDTLQATCDVCETAFTRAES